MDLYKTGLVLLILLQLSDLNDLDQSSVMVREGSGLSLSCRDVSLPQPQCTRTTWDFYSRSGGEKLFVYGRKQNMSSTVTLSQEDCSLVLRPVSAGQAGLYRCTQHSRGFGQRQVSDTRLSVVSVNEQRVASRVTLRCSVSGDKSCKYKLKWLNDGHKVDKDHRELRTSHSYCMAIVSFPEPSQFSQTLQCEVTDDKGQTFTTGRNQDEEKPSLRHKQTTTTTSLMTQAPKSTEPSAVTDVLQLVSWVLPVVILILVLVVFIIVFVVWRMRRENSRRPVPVKEPEEVS